MNTHDIKSRNHKLDRAYGAAHETGARSTTTFYNL